MKTLSNAKEVKAKKEHRCNFCNYVITTDTKYMKSTHIHADQVYDWKTHKHCAELATKMDMYEYCDDGLTMDDFMAAVSDKHGDILTGQLPDSPGFGDIISQLHLVVFRHKLSFVIRYFNKQETK